MKSSRQQLRITHYELRIELSELRIELNELRFCVVMTAESVGFCEVKNDR